MDLWKTSVPLNDGIGDLSTSDIASFNIRIQDNAFPLHRQIYKSQIVNIFSFAGHMVSVITIQSCCGSVRAAVNNT